MEENTIEGTAAGTVHLKQDPAVEGVSLGARHGTGPPSERGPVPF